MNVITILMKGITAIVRHWIFQTLFVIFIFAFAWYKHKQKEREYGDY